MEHVEVDITPAQVKLWSDTRAALIWHCPAFTHLLYTMMNKRNGEHIAFFTRDIPIAATDGSHILLNPDTFFTFPLAKRLFIVCHEICHGMFGHVELMYKLYMAGKVCYPDGKELAYDGEVMNWAMDFVINDLLIESKIGEYDPSWLWNKKIGTHMNDVLTVYRKIFVERPPIAGQGFDLHLKPGATTNQDPATAAASRNEIEWKTAIAGALATGRAQDKMPAALKRLLEETLTPLVDWTDKVIGYFARKPGGGSYNWRKPDRRLITRNIIAPGRTGFGCGIVVVGLDTSGSIGQNELSVFFGEMAGILDDIRPQRLILMWADAKVHRVDEVEDMADLIDIRMHKGAPGGGGTSFVPVFDKIEELELDVDSLIYLTDGHGTFPGEAPDYPVLWGSIDKKSYPFGEVIHVPIKN